MGCPLVSAVASALAKSSGKTGVLGEMKTFAQSTVSVKLHFCVGELCEFSLSVSDIGLWLAITAIILLVASELLYASPNLASRIPMDKRLLRLLAVGCGLGFLVMVIMRAMGLS